MLQAVLQAVLVSCALLGSVCILGALLEVLVLFWVVAGVVFRFDGEWNCQQILARMKFAGMSIRPA